MGIYVIEYEEMYNYKSVACCSSDLKILKAYNDSLENKGKIDYRNIDFDITDLDMIFTIDFYIHKIDSYVDSGIYMASFEEANRYVNSKVVGNRKNWQVRGLAIIR